jgi:hypothetical protein
VIGGSAVEFYTTGGYASADLDLVMLHPEDADRVLGASGFERRGRYWSLPDTDLLVEFPGQTLTYAPGAYDRLTEVEMGDGLAATIIGIEDILIDRLYAAVSERRANDRRWRWRWQSSTMTAWIGVPWMRWPAPMASRRRHVRCTQKRKPSPTHENPLVRCRPAKRPRPFGCGAGGCRPGCAPGSAPRRGAVAGPAAA